MRCSVCGTYIPDGQNNCGVCGYAVKGQTIRMIRLICADCGGVMDVDLNRPMEKCPYCNSKRLLIKGDKTRIVKIKSFDELRMDMMIPYTAMERVRIKQRIDDECDRRYHESAPVVKVYKKNSNRSSVDHSFIAVMAILAVIIIAILLIL